MEEFSDPAIEVHFEYTRKDVALGALWALYQNQSMRFLYGAVGLTAVYWVVTSLREAQVPSWRFFVFLAAWGLSPALVVVGGWFQHRRIPSGARRQSYTFSDRGVDISSAVGNASLTWQAFERAVETRGAFYLSPQRGLWHVIPKRAFGGAAQIDRTRTCLAENLGARARLQEVTSALP